ncbi:hypothetical protein IW262DRAFT_1292634 [Armillaria fumosa]|nr:hypothetical protein IW262DRAFT_1292634 [Armillaria fumosa]
MNQGPITGTITLSETANSGSESRTKLIAFAIAKPYKGLGNVSNTIFACAALYVGSRTRVKVIEIAYGGYLWMLRHPWLAASPLTRSKHQAEIAVFTHFAAPVPKSFLSEEAERGGGNVSRQLRRSPWSVIRTRNIHTQPSKWKTAIETDNSFVVAKGDTSAVASTNLPRYGDGNYQPKVDPSHSPGDDAGCPKFGPPKIRCGQDYNDSPEGEIVGLEERIAWNETEILGGDVMGTESQSRLLVSVNNQDANPAPQSLGIRGDRANIGWVKRRDG